MLVMHPIIPAPTTMPDPQSQDSGNPLIASLRRPGCYPHAAAEVQLLETHISWVLLAGIYAYKIKKPVNLGFLDFSTLELRRRCCLEELRLNRRFAPQLYLDMVRITAGPQGPCINGNGPAIEYAVRMKQFPQDALASAMLSAGRLTPQLLEDFASMLADFHLSAPVADAGSPLGSATAIIDSALQSLDQIETRPTSDTDGVALTEIRAWTLREHDRLHETMEQRRIAGHVRECHGDLHLGNIVLIDDRLVPFDCIEFNVALRWNDVISEVAFLVMDLHDRGSPQHAWLFLNAWLEHSGDYAGIVLLPFYLVYRAMVRAKVHALRAAQSGVSHAEHARLMGESRRYIALARHFSHGKPPALIITHGLSGSGKSRIAGEVMQQLGAIRIRSDVERKRLHGLAPLDSSASAVGSGLYSAEATQRLYAHLTSLAEQLIVAGQTVIADATFLQRWQRDRLCAVARENQMPLFIMNVTAPEDVLRARIRQRRTTTNDPSDADNAVLDHQLATQEPLASDEESVVVELPSAQLTPGMCCEHVINAMSTSRHTK